MNTSNHNSIPRLAGLAVALALALAGCASHSQTLPAQTPPAGLRAGYAQIQVAAVVSAGARPVWLGRAAEAEPHAVFAIAAPAEFAHMVPPVRKIGVYWHAWFRAPARGEYSIAVEIAGGNLQASSLTIAAVFVNGQRAVNGWRGDCRAKAGCEAAATSATGKVALAQGWHEIKVEAMAPVVAAPRAKVSLSIRAPGAAAAVPLVPYWPAAATK